MADQPDKEITKILFQEFWRHYPKKEGKKIAWEKFNKLDQDTQRKVAAHVAERALTDVKWLAGFCPMASTFFNQERWDDEYEVSAAKTKTGKADKPAIETIICDKCKDDTRTQRHTNICEYEMPYYDLKIGGDYYLLSNEGTGAIKVN